MKIGKNIIRITSVVMVLILVVTLAMPLFTSANAQDDFNAAQAELDKINQQLNSIQSEKKKQEQQKANAQNQINLVKKQLASLAAQVEDASNRLAEKQAELDQKKIDIYETDELFKQKLKAMYVRRSGGMLATMLAVDSFSEMLTAANTLQHISKADTALLEKLDREKKAIEEVENQIQQELVTLEQNRAKQEAKQNELVNLLKSVNANLSDTQAQEEAAQASYENAKAIRDAAAKKLEEEFAQGGGMGDFVGGEWKWPVPSSRRVSSHYGYRNIFGYNELHTGVDIPAGYGQAIVASNSGVVTTATYSNSGYGNRIIIDHGGNQKTLYAHCSSLAVNVGDFVTQGQVIAYIGSTGLSTGNHLHFEIRMNGATVDPYPYIKNN